MKNYVVTIARGFGSGGKQIGLKLAEELGIKLIDKELIQLASIESGISEELFAKVDERIKTKLWGLVDAKSFIGDVLTPERKMFTSDINLFNYQVKVLRNLASTESFVVIGKAADYVLEEFPNVLSVSIQASLDYCVKSIVSRAQVDRYEAEKLVKNTDRYRSDYYKYYTGKDWRETNNYDLCLNSEKLGRENCVEVIKAGLRSKLGVDIA